jgi:polysaccharide pyruvyl transferase WcaK-like protein
MLGQELDVWSIRKTPVDWDYVRANYQEVIVGGAGLLHSVFEPFWIDLEKNCDLPITIWGIGVCLPESDSVKGVSKKIVKSVFDRAEMANIRDELTRDFYDLDPSISITACPTLHFVAEEFDVSAQKKLSGQVLHSWHTKLEPGEDGPLIKRAIKQAGYRYSVTENIETRKESLRSILELYPKSEFVVTTRLHGAIIAYAFQRPYVAISYDPKILAFQELYGGGVCIKDASELSTVINEGKFRTLGNYWRELERVREFGEQARARLMGK